MLVSENAVKAAAASGARIRGVHLTFPAPTAIEVLAQGANLQFLYIDGEHGRFDWSDIEFACVAAERHGLTPIARIPDISVATITRFLDRGVRGLACPHIESVEDAELVVQAAYYAPLGQRSYGAGRPDYGVAVGDLTSHMTALNRAVSICLMIETQKAVDIAGELAAVKGIDYLSFGMHDLATDLGHPGDSGHADVKAAAAVATKRIHDAGKRVREDFMHFAWINDLLLAGARQLLPG